MGKGYGGFLLRKLIGVGGNSACILRGWGFFVSAGRFIEKLIWRYCLCWG